MEISNAGIEFIKDWEKFRAHPYYDSAHVLTIGYGLTRLGGRPIHLTDKITEPEALAGLLQHIKNNVEPRLNSLLDGLPLEQNQYDALCSFCYNVGTPRFANSTLYSRVMRPGTPAEKIAQAFLMWNKETRGGQLVTSNGLINRRNAEIKLYFSHENRNSNNNEEQA